MAENVNPAVIQDQEEVKVQAGRARAALPAADLPDKVHTWPYLVRAEFIAGCILLLVLMVWSITVDAPMEDPANPTKTPNLSKAPWTSTRGATAITPGASASSPSPPSWSGSSACGWG